VFFFLANYRQISTFFKGHPPVKWKKRGGGGGEESLKFSGKHAMAKCFGPESLVMTWWNRHPIRFQGVDCSHGES
jgi:hypothetical protein